MRRIRLWAATGALLAIGACSDSKSNEMPSQIPLTEWVDQMVALTDENDPDTVEDKVGVVVDTDSETAFDKFFPAP